MFTDRVMESVKLICMAVGAATIVLILLGVWTWAFAAESKEMVIMSKETFDLIVKALNACQSHRI